MISSRKNMISSFAKIQNLPDLAAALEYSSQWPKFDDRNKQLLIDQLAMFDANKDPGKLVLGESLIYQGMFVNCRCCRKHRAVLDG